MSTLTLSPPLFDRDATLFDDRAAVSEERAALSDDHSTLSDGPTLDDVIVAGWHQISSGAPAPCPVCHGELTPVWSAGPRPVGARCQDCGSRLS